MNWEIIEIEDIIIYIQRKEVKNINLRINKDLKIIVSANQKVKLERIEIFLKSKIQWIKKNSIKMKSNYLKRQNNEIKEYISGEEIKLSGRQYRLNVIEGKSNKVVIKDLFVNLYINDKCNYKKKKSIIDKFIYSKAVEFFEESLYKMLEIVKSHNVEKPEMIIRKMKSRWGSCNRSKKKITINYELVKVPKDCLEYVILHELIHFLVKEHNKEFYSLLSVFMPDWKNRKKLLDEEYVFL